MKARLVLALLSVCMISGCHSYGHLYQVRGPLASASASPVYAFSFTFPGSPRNEHDQNGDFSMVLFNGEKFQGPWKMMYRKPGAPIAAVGTPVSGNMAAAWDTVYGQGFYVAQVLGAPYFAHTMLTGSQGTTLRIEWRESELRGATIVDTKGVAQDSKGNIYKLVL
jgi:hypothetical protein